MPRVNIYIRNDNEAAWNSIADKSAWVNAILEADVVGAFKAEVTPPKESPKPVGEINRGVAKQASGPPFGGKKLCPKGHQVIGGYCVAGCRK